MQWLVKQPGQDLIEKAGQRRSLKVVQRFESFDTLENRVFLDFLRRAKRLARKYVRDYADRFPSHHWILATKKLLRVCERLLLIPEFQTIGLLSAIPQPNYVLLHDSRYHEIWWGYLQLLRQSERRRQLWLDRESAWAEMSFVALTSSLASIAKRTNRAGYRQAIRFDVWINAQTIKGRKLGDSTFSPAWRDARDRKFILLQSSQLKQGGITLPNESFAGCLNLLFQEPYGENLIVSLQPQLDSFSGLGANGDTVQVHCYFWRMGQSIHERERTVTVPARMTDSPTCWDDFCLELQS